MWKAVWRPRRTCSFLTVTTKQTFMFMLDSKPLLNEEPEVCSVVFAICREDHFTDFNRSYPYILYIYI